MHSKSLTSSRVPVAIALLIGLFAPHPARGQTPAASGRTPRTVDPAGLRDLINSQEADYNCVDRFFDLPWSEQRFDRLEQAIRMGRQRLADLPFDTLSQAAKVDYILMRNRFDAEATRVAHDREHLSEMADLLPFRRTILDLELARRAMKPVDAAGSATQIGMIDEQIKQARERIEAAKNAPATSQPAQTPSPTSAPTPVSAVTARRAADAVQALHGTLDAWFSFYDNYQPSFSWWLKKPHEAAAAVLADYAKYLRETVAGLHGNDDDPLTGAPIGAAALADDLTQEMIPYTPTELIAIGERDLAWCEGEMARAAAEMGLAGNPKAALAKVKDDFVPPGEEDALIASQAHEIIAYIKDHDLVTIPPLCEEVWRLARISTQDQKWLPFAAYSSPNILIAYATDEMKNDEKLMAMRGNNREFTRVSILHELIPGHHLQGFVSQRERPYRGLFGTPFFVEGWSLYWEITLYDLGYAKTPEQRIGMLFWRMTRDARVIVSLKFHLGQMTPQQMVDFLVERVGHERSGATGEVRRFIGEGYGPLYQCGYLIGGLQLRALRKELVDTKRMSEREFHDALLSYGPIPIELLRDELLNLPLTRDTRASWKFAGETPGK